MDKVLEKEKKEIEKLNLKELDPKIQELIDKIAAIMIDRFFEDQEKGIVHIPSKKNSQ